MRDDYAELRKDLEHASHQCPFSNDIRHLLAERDELREALSRCALKLRADELRENLPYHSAELEHAMELLGWTSA